MFKLLNTNVILIWLSSKYWDSVIQCKQHYHYKQDITIHRDPFLWRHSPTESFVNFNRPNTCNYKLLLLLTVIVVVKKAYSFYTTFIGLHLFGWAEIRWTPPASDVKPSNIPCNHVLMYSIWIRFFWQLLQGFCGRACICRISYLCIKSV